MCAIDKDLGIGRGWGARRSIEFQKLELSSPLTISHGDIALSRKQQAIRLHGMPPKPFFPMRLRRVEMVSCLALHF
jgi:hypothetical protein